MAKARTGDSLRAEVAGLVARYRRSLQTDRRYLWTLARAHARSGDRIAIAAYLGRSDVFDQAISEFAAAYADQNERDYQALAAGAASGRVTAHRNI